MPPPFTDSTWYRVGEEMGNGGEGVPNADGAARAAPVLVARGAVSVAQGPLHGLLRVQCRDPALKIPLSVLVLQSTASPAAPSFGFLFPLYVRRGDSLSTGLSVPGAYCLANAITSLRVSLSCHVVWTTSRSGMSP